MKEKRLWTTVHDWKMRIARRDARYAGDDETRWKLVGPGNNERKGNAREKSNEFHHIRSVRNYGNSVITYHRQALIINCYISSTITLLSTSVTTCSVLRGLPVGQAWAFIPTSKAIGRKSCRPTNFTANYLKRRSTVRNNNKL